MRRATSHSLTSAPCWRSAVSGWRPTGDALPAPPGGMQISNDVSASRTGAPHIRRFFFRSLSFLSPIVVSVQNDRYGSARRSIGIAETASKFGISKGFHGRVRLPRGFHGAQTLAPARGLWSAVSKVYFFPSGIRPAQPTSAGGYTVPNVVSASLIDALRGLDHLTRRGWRAQRTAGANRGALLHAEPPLIWRRRRPPTVTVQADVMPRRRGDDDREGDVVPSTSSALRSRPAVTLCSTA